jgi:hypothetical protein
MDGRGKIGEWIEMDKMDEGSQEIAKLFLLYRWKWRPPVTVLFFPTSCAIKKCLTNQMWSLYIAQQSERKKKTTYSSKSQKKGRLEEPGKKENRKGTDQRVVTKSIAVYLGRVSRFLMFFHVSSLSPLTSSILFSASFIDFVSTQTEVRHVQEVYIRRRWGIPEIICYSLISSTSTECIHRCPRFFFSSCPLGKDILVSFQLFRSKLDIILFVPRITGKSWQFWSHFCFLFIALKWTSCQQQPAISTRVVIV